MYYIECSSVDGCLNLYYNSPNCIGSVYEYTSLCTQKFIPYNSSLGTKPDFITRNIISLMFLIVGSFLFVNTIFFNKGFIKSLNLGGKLE
jgi:hypothetical protein